VHEGRGYERVYWQAALTNTEQDIQTETTSKPKTEIDTKTQTQTQNQTQTNAVDHVTRGQLPPMSSKKHSLIDLTGKRNVRLANEGFSWLGHNHSQGHPHSHLAHEISNDKSMSSASPKTSAGAGPEKASPRNSPNAPSLSVSSPSPSPGLSTDISTTTISNSTTISGTIGQFEYASQTLRRETCIVNAAVVATSFPHHGGKRFNSPVVIDLELPAWQDPTNG
jgi:hypothetical protein